ncbi:MAG: SDR family NAD(P)-dependent oxidoreductase [Vicinamibacterales bacterium]
MRRERAVRSLPATAAAAVGALATIGGVALWLERRSRRRFDFAGKVVLITGGSRGLGLVLARGLVEKGARVALMARQRDELDRAVGSVGDEASVYAVAGDVRSAESCSRVVDAVVARFGRLDVLINNAGVILSAPIAETSEADFHALMDVHFWGALRMTRAALPQLVDSQGRIATVCSIGGKIAVPHLSAVLRKQVRAGRAVRCSR